MTFASTGLAGLWLVEFNPKIAAFMSLTWRFGRKAIKK